MQIKQDDEVYNIIRPPLGNKGEVLVVTYIDRYLDAKANTGSYQVDDLFKPKDYEYLHPSNECLMCSRLLYFTKVKKYDKMLVDGIDIKARKTFKLGHAIHGMIQAWFEDMADMGMVDNVEVECSVRNEELKIKGSVDLLVKFPGCEYEIPIELKSISEPVLKRLSAPKPEHVMQVSTYSLLKNCPYGIVLYFTKEYPHDFKEYMVEPVDMGLVLNKWSKVQNAKAAKSPKALAYECEVGSTKYNRCPARIFCRREGFQVM